MPFKVHLQEGIPAEEQVEHLANSVTRSIESSYKVVLKTLPITSKNNNEDQRYYI